MNVEDEHLRGAIDRISRTPDGRMLYLFLQKTLSSFPVTDGSVDALRDHNGRRMFAHDLMAIMAAGIRETHGGRDPTDGPITFAGPKPVAVSGRTSARDWLARNDPELNAKPGTGS